MAEEPMMDENKERNGNTVVFSRLTPPEPENGAAVNADTAEAAVSGRKPGKSRKAEVSLTDSKTAEAEEPCENETVQQEPQYDDGIDLAEYTLRKRSLPSLWNWFMTFLIMDLPVAGIITLIIWAFGPHTDDVKRGFARARLLYRILFLGTSVLLLWLLFRTFLPKAEELLDYLQKM